MYHYAGNNPVKYTDPDGRDILNAFRTFMSSAGDAPLGKSNLKIKNFGCVLTAYTRMASTLLGDEISLSYANAIAIENNLFVGEKDKENLLTPENGAALVNAILKSKGITDIEISFDGSYTGQSAVNKYNEANISDDKFFATVRISTNDLKGNEYGHTMNLDSDAYKQGVCGVNLLFNDTSGIRTQLVDDPSGRKNKFIRMDFFSIKYISTTGETE